MAALYGVSSTCSEDELDKDGLDDIMDRVEVNCSGTVYPWGYGGHDRTLFGIHFEDAWMPSANLHIAGEPKVWIFIRKADYSRLSDLLKCQSFHL